MEKSNQNGFKILIYDGNFESIGWKLFKGADIGQIWVQSFIKQEQTLENVTSLNKKPSA